MKNTNTRDANIFFLPSGDHSPTKETNVQTISTKYEKFYARALKNYLRIQMKIEESLHNTVHI